MSRGAARTASGLRPGPKDRNVGTVTSFVPEAWRHFQRDFAETAAVLADGRAPAQRARKQIQKRIEVLRAELETTIPPVGVSGHLPKAMAEGIRTAIVLLRSQQGKLLEALSQAAEVFESAEENEDRFVVLVFGEVNAGKSALANHLAGLDYEGAPVHGEAFVGAESVPRLAESPIECTRQYQGFRLPGLLWIDCPGILSGTFANAQLAGRLVARADFLVFASMSDAPFKASEMKELAALVGHAGQETLDACLVVTKADHFDVDEDSTTGREIRRVVAKSVDDLQAQAAWCQEQLISNGIERRVRMQAPLSVSVYVGRDALGRRWEDGTLFRPPGRGWEAKYAKSGLLGFCELLGRLVREHGAALKAQWPQKRAAALNRLFQETAARSAAEIDRLTSELDTLRSELANARKGAIHDAAETSASKVGDCLTVHGIHRHGQFDQRSAHKALEQVLQGSVRDAVTEATKSILDQIRTRFDAAVATYVQNTSFSLDVRERFKTHTYYTSKRSEGIAGAVGGLGGAIGGAALGTAIFPGVGTVAGFIGGLLGSLLGGTGARAIARKTIRQEVTVRVSAGTNGSEVIAATQEEMRRLSRNAVVKVFHEIDAAVFGQLASELERLRSQVDRWGDVAFQSGGRASRRPLRRPRRT